MEVIVNLEAWFWEQQGVASPLRVGVWEEWFTTWLKELTRDLPPAKAYELTIRFTGDQEIQALNQQYRQRNQPTDILAFAALETAMPMPPEESGDPLYLGDLVISVETAASQALTRGHSLKLELAWLATHGCLHLLGWDHPDETSLEKMLHKQQQLLTTVGLNLDLL